MQPFWEVYWKALHITELCAEVYWIFTFQEPVDCTTAVHSFDATPLLESNPLADLVDVEEDGLWQNFLPTVVHSMVKDHQCLQNPMHDVTTRKMAFATSDMCNEPFIL